MRTIWIRICLVALLGAVAAVPAAAQPCCGCCGQDTTWGGEGEGGGMMEACCQDEFFSVLDVDPDLLLAQAFPPRSVGTYGRADVRTYYRGREGKFSGVVTHVARHGHRVFMQTLTGGPWSGMVMVRNRRAVDAHPLEVGDEVVVRGKVREHWGRYKLVTPQGEEPQITNFSTVTTATSSKPMPPVYEGPMTQFQGNATNVNALMWERCLVRVPGPLKVAGFPSRMRVRLVPAVTTIDDGTELLLDVSSFAVDRPPYGEGDILSSVEGVLDSDYPVGSYVLLARRPEDVVVFRTATRGR